MRFLGHCLCLFVSIFIVDSLLQYLGYDLNEGSVQMGSYIISVFLTCAVIFLFAIISDKLTSNKKDPNCNRAGEHDRRDDRPAK